MKIMIYTPGVSQKVGGVYQYTISLINSLCKGCPQHEFFIYLDGSGSDFQSSIRSIKGPHIVELKSSSLGKSRFISILRRLINAFSTRLFHKQLWKATGPIDKFVKKNKINVIHCPFQNVYKVDGVPAITTIHDVQELHFPGFFSSAVRAARAVGNKNAIDKSDAVIVSYVHIKKDVEFFFNKPDTDIIVCPIELTNSWLNQYGELHCEKINPFSEYILYPAATWEHKNHLRLLEALAKIRDRDGKKINLITTGALKDYYYLVLQHKLKELNLENQIKFEGIVSEEYLYSLYINSRAVVIPTLYEAGSFPLMESILLNIPVICSNVTSLPDTIGDNKFVFDPFNISEMADKIELIVEDSNYRDQNIANSKIASKRLLDSHSAFIINRLYDRLAVEKGAS